MKVFVCKRQGGYSGGLILVAANTKEEAFMVAARDKKTEWMFHGFDDEGYYVRERTDIGHVGSDYYPLLLWMEVETLTADVDKPMLLMEDGYTE